MAKLTREERDAIARKRLLRILETHGVASARTLEQKISDAGPNPQRVDPHILTPMRNALVKEGRLSRTLDPNTTWFHRTDTHPAVVGQRLAEQRPIFRTLMAANQRIGQTLEIATYRALLPAHPFFHGRFRDLEEHDDSTLYKKEEPPQHLGARGLPGDQRLDFMIVDREAGAIGIECKNVREWIYPDRSEVTETAIKCLAIDCVPVLIARRVPYVTFRLLNSCGWVIHQTFTQLVPNTLSDAAEQAKNKRLLGFHDLRVGNYPDNRLTKFIHHDLVPAVIKARPRFDANKDLLERFATKDISYAEFAARLRRREKGQNEDHDWPDQHPEEWAAALGLGDPADWLGDDE